MKKTSMRTYRSMRFSTFCRDYFLLLLITIFFFPAQSQATRWTLVEFGDSEPTTITPYSDWDEILRHPGHTEFVDPDGDPTHSGIVQTAAVPDERTAFFGIRGTTPINFLVGHKIVATFYNRSAGEEYLSCRVSFTDADSPDPSDSSNGWHTLYSIDAPPETQFLLPVPGNTLVEMEYYITNASMVSVFNAPATAGNHTLVNLNLPSTTTSFVLTKIELSDEADITPPSAVLDLTALTISTSQDLNNVVELRWSPATDPGAGALGIRAYYIYRDGALYDLVPKEMVDHMGDDLFWQDIFVVPNTTYEYTVTAVDRAPFGIYPTTEHPNRRRGNESTDSARVTVATPPWGSSTLINPEARLLYLGAFRLPDDGGMGQDWAYAHRGLAYYPGGNPGYDPATELPGSLFAYNLSDEIGEVSIPKPLISTNPDDLPRARTLQPQVDLFPNLYGGSSTPSGGAGKAIGLAYHPAANGVPERLYYSISNYYGTDPSAAALGSFDLDLTLAEGAWHVGALPSDNVPPGLISTIVFQAPQSWASTHTGDRSLIIGNTYISGCGVPSNGPSLYAVAPWESGSLPENGGFVSAVKLLRYSSNGELDHRNINASWDEFGEGGAFLTVMDQSAVAISYRRSIGDVWYGYSNGVNNCEYNIPEPEFGSYGVGVTDWAAGLLLYNADDLAAVANGSLDSWDPLPYVGYDLARFSIREGGGKEAGAIGYDRDNGYLYFIEHNGDPGYEYGYSLIHVWGVGGPAVEADELAVDFGPSGLWHYDADGTWTRISTGNADGLENYRGDLAADFGTSGLCLYDGTWTRISTGNSEGLKGAATTLYVDFGSLGLWQYSGTWERISTGDAEQMETYDNRLVADFGTLGLYEYDGTWTRISTGNAEECLGVGSDLYVDFGSSGLWHYRDGWTRISTGDPEDLECFDGMLAADFGTFGLYLYHEGWTRISTGNGEEIVSCGPDLFVDFGAAGFWRYNAGAWTKISTGNSESLGCYENKLAADFGTSGLYEFDNTWTRISTGNAEEMVGVNIKD